MTLTLHLTVNSPILGDTEREQRHMADQLIQVANDILKGKRTGETRRNGKRVCTWTVKEESLT